LNLGHVGSKLLPWRKAGRHLYASLHHAANKLVDALQASSALPALPLSLEAWIGMPVDVLRLEATTSVSYFSTQRPVSKPLFSDGVRTNAGVIVDCMFQDRGFYGSSNRITKEESEITIPASWAILGDRDRGLEEAAGQDFQGKISVSGRRTRYFGSVPRHRLVPCNTPRCLSGYFSPGICLRIRAGMRCSCIQPLQVCK
jgi:hypothetical protein